MKRGFLIRSKWIISLPILALILVGCASVGQEIRLEEKAPGFSFVNFDGKTFSLEDYEGKNIVLYFYRGFY